MGPRGTVGFTKRGHAAYSKVHSVLRDIERDGVSLGPKNSISLKTIFRVGNSPLRGVANGFPADQGRSSMMVDVSINGIGQAPMKPSRWPWKSSQRPIR